MTIPATLTSALAGRYDIERELGAGGMATVYLARDSRHNRHVAVKVMNPALGAAVGVERFLAEIRTTARLAHPNILPLHDSGEADGFLFYVMPFIEGESLRTRLAREGKLSIGEAVRLAREIADALAYAHSHDVIHRDIKPENILMQSGHALVADFGVARAMSVVQESRITATGLALGTPAYMSPEQAAGETAIDGRTDLYALGCVLYEMLTGESPFPSDNARRVMALKLTQRPPRPSLKRGEIPAALDSAVTKAMATATDDRFATIAAFVAALGANATAETERRSIAVLPFENMSDDPSNEYFSDGISEEIINALAHLPGLHVAARTSAFSFKGTKLDLRSIGDQLGVSTVLEGSVRKAGNRLRITAQLIKVADGYHLWSERYDRDATDLFAVQDEIAAAIAAKFDIKADQVAGRAVRGTDNLEAYDLYLQGRAFELERGPSLLRAVDCFEKSVAIDARYAAAYAELAKSLLLLSMWGQSHPDDTHPRATEAVRHALDCAPDLVAGHTARALLAMLAEQDLEGASAAWSRAVALDPNDGEAQCLRAVYDLGYVRNETDAGERAIRAAIAADPLNVSFWAHLSVVLSFGGRYAPATTAAARAVELGPRSFYAQWTYVQTLYFGPDATVGATAARTMLTWFGRHTWPMMALGVAAGRSGESDIASAVYAELEARSRSTYVQPFALAIAAIGAGRRADALRHLREAKRVRDPLFAMLMPHYPVLDELRGEPEFQAIMRELGWDGC